MLLRLFKDPFPEPFSEGKIRLLFERVEDENTPAQGRPDFYLYVWIQDMRLLAGFQAVLNEEFVLDYRPPSHLEFTRIAGKPLKRSLREQLTPQEREAFLSHMKAMECPVFTQLIRRIESVIHGAPAAFVELTQEERATLMDLILPEPDSNE
jgi:hypothetical protein